MINTRRKQPADRAGIRDPKGLRIPARAGIRFTANTYLVQTQPGLEALAMEEIMARCQADAAKRRPDGGGVTVTELARRVVPGRAGMCLFDAPQLEPLCDLRCAEDLFAVVGYRRGLPLDRLALDRLRATARQAAHVETALAARLRVTPGSRTGQRLKYRVIARMVGAQEFRRAEFRTAIERGIGDRGDRNWRLVEEQADVEFWATLLEDELLLTIRLTGDSMRQRDYKVAHVPGSLRPAIAAALGLLSKPQPDDVVLDPFCGAGTILIERAHAGRYQKLIGSDLDQAALEAARENIGPRYKPIALHAWDAVAIRLPDSSISRIITNLPWGLQHGSHADNRRLYPLLFGEFARLLRADGVAVMLTGETRMMGELLRGGALRAEKVVRVSILGRPAAIYVCPRA